MFANVLNFLRNKVQEPAIVWLIKFQFNFILLSHCGGLEDRLELLADFLLAGALDDVAWETGTDFKRGVDPLER